MVWVCEIRLYLELGYDWFINAGLHGLQFYEYIARKAPHVSPVVLNPYYFKPQSSLIIKNYDAATCMTKGLYIG